MAKYTERQKELATSVMANVVPIAVTMFFLVLIGICFSKAGVYTSNMTQRRFLVLAHCTVVVIQVFIVGILFWSRRVARNGQGKL